jgi:hypothetical protein
VTQLAGIGIADTPVHNPADQREQIFRGRSHPREIGDEAFEPLAAGVFQENIEVADDRPTGELKSCRMKAATA